MQVAEREVLTENGENKKLVKLGSKRKMVTCEQRKTGMVWRPCTYLYRRTWTQAYYSQDKEIMSAHWSSEHGKSATKLLFHHRTLFVPDVTHGRTHISTWRISPEIAGILPLNWSSWAAQDWRCRDPVTYPLCDC